MHDNNISNKLFSKGTDVAGLQAEYQDEDIILFGNSNLFLGQQTIRTKFNFFMLCYAGSLSVTINDIPQKVGPATLLRCPAEAVVSNAVVSDDFKYSAIAITDQALQSYLRGNIYIWNLVIYKYKRYTMELSENDLAFLRKFHELLRCSLDKSTMGDNLSFRKNIIKGLVETELNAFCFKIEVEEAEKEPSPRQLELFNQFLNLLQQRKVKRVPLEQYASELCISSKYLTAICKKHSGKTATQWIQEYIISDATYYLSSTSLSIKEISNLMGFPNCSYFCKYIKEYLHYSPKEYRKRIKGRLDRTKIADR
ncbi:MAG: helix-turn-helix domain-containing protein [Prevotella sp.]|jgi:AraC-like DNA-binding protein